MTAATTTPARTRTATGYDTTRFNPLDFLWRKLPELITDPTTPDAYLLSQVCHLGWRGELWPALIARPRHTKKMRTWLLDEMTAEVDWGVARRPTREQQAAAAAAYLRAGLAISDDELTRLACKITVRGVEGDQFREAAAAHPKARRDTFAWLITNGGWRSDAAAVIAGRGSRQPVAALHDRLRSATARGIDYMIWLTIIEDRIRGRLRAADVTIAYELALAWGGSLDELLDAVDNLSGRRRRAGN